MLKRQARRERLSYYLKFTLFFILIELIMYAPFLLLRKALVWEHDSYTQHVKAMIYISRWYRQLGKSLLHGRFSELATYSFAIGYGSDAMSTLAYYGVGDPLYVLSALIPAKYIYLYYCALIPFKNYLTGLAVSAFLRRRWPEEANRNGVLCGALIYTFCGFVLITCVGQPIFLNALIVYPLMLLGIEKVYDGEKPWLFIISAFLATVCNFYFLLSIVLMAVIYALFRYFPMPFSEIGKRFSQIFTMLAGGVVGVAMGGFLLLPMALTVFGNKRVDLNRTIGIFYDLRSCRLLPVAFLASEEVEYGALCYAGLALLCVFLLLSARGRIKLKIQFLLYTVLLFVPYFGYLTNGLSYPIDRWCWAYSALIACIVAEVWPQLFVLTRRQKASMGIGLTLYFFLCNILDDRMQKNYLLPVVFAALTLAFLLMSQWEGEVPALRFDGGLSGGNGFGGDRSGENAPDASLSGGKSPDGDLSGGNGSAGSLSGGKSFGSMRAVEVYDERKERRFRRAQTGIVLITVLSICINGVCINYPDIDNRVGVYKDLRALSSHTSGLGASPANDRNMWINDTAQIVSAAGLSKTAFNRVSNTEPGYWYQNTSMLNGVSTTQSFWSINNSHVLEYLDVMAVSDANNNAWQFTNLDNRTILNELASVSYLYCMHPEKLPYGYSEKSLDPDTANSTYENLAPLSLGYAYESAVSRDTFDALTPAQRQEVLMTHAVVEDPGALADARSIDDLRADLDCKEVPFKTECLDWGVNQTEDGAFAVTNAGARVRLTFDTLTGGECYLYLKNIQFTESSYVDLYLGDESVDPKNQYTVDDWNALSRYEKYRIRKDLYDKLPTNNIKIGASFGVTEGKENASGSKAGDAAASEATDAAAEKAAVAQVISGESAGGSSAPAEDASVRNVTYNEINYILPDNYQFYSGRQDFLLNSYVLREGVNTITITFPSMGVYRFDEMSVISEPLTGYDDKVAALSAESLQNVDIHQNESSFSTGRVDGEITVAGDRLLCLTIPYSEGWTAYVDGEKVPVEIANIMFTGIRLTAGHHTVSLRYETPGLRPGLLLTAGGLLLFIVWLVVSKVLARKSKAEEMV